MGLKDFMNKMAQKQADSNRKMAAIREKSQAKQEELEEKKNAMLDAMHPFSDSKKREEKEYQKERIQQLKKEHIPYCPKCKSTNITYLDKRKKLSLGRAAVGGVVGGVLTGGLGAAAGATMGGLSSNKIKKGKVKCLNCGHTWKL
ncbi:MULTISPECIES: hypothetical protein [Clostridium]|uniref:hypothetical protein n=1 Tax=Clostridium TaxID=1485 RepID=UPI00069E602E|nr:MULTISPECIES: hypothetical protein [Clostridium]KOF56615.1 hypothetical protein AGR56_07730 [Clostridium sp. DMHC 10]MCD2348474.1 hypothetical protein [Clostridium guangxiense]